jgi:hypothetical protein
MTHLGVLMDKYGDIREKLKELREKPVPVNYSVEIK